MGIEPAEQKGEQNVEFYWKNGLRPIVAA